MDKRSNQSSVIDEEYEEEISNLRSQIHTLEYQIADFKSYIKNQKTIHTKELEQLKATYESSIQHVVNKYEKQLQSLNNQLGQARIQNRPADARQQQTYTLTNILSNEVNTRVQMLTEVLTNKLTRVSSQLHLLQQNAVKHIRQMVQRNSKQKLMIMALESDLMERNALVARQKQFVERIIQEKKDSDMMYEKQLTFLEDLYAQKRVMYQRLQKVNGDLQTENTQMRDIVGRRHTEYPAVYINLEDGERPTKTPYTHTTQPTDRKMSKNHLKSTKQDFSLMSNSPLRSIKINDSRKATSPPIHCRSRMQSIPKIHHNATTKNKEIQKKTAKNIDMVQSNCLKLLMKEKENLDK